jgi:hypothetical protein
MLALLAPFFKSLSGFPWRGASFHVAVLINLNEFMMPDDLSQSDIPLVKEFQFKSAK